MHIIEVLRKQPKPLRFLMSRILCFLHFNELFTISRPFYKLKFFNTSISKNLWIDNKGRMEDENFLKDYLRRGDFMIDVGANIGTLTLTASSILADNKQQPSIVAIEANQNIYECLVKKYSAESLAECSVPVERSHR